MTSYRGSVHHHVLIIETGMGSNWRTWAECQTCGWTGLKQITSKLAERDAEAHANAE